MEILVGALVAIGAVVLGWFLNRFTSRSERRDAWKKQLQVRQAEVLADLTMMLEGHDLSHAAVTTMDNIPDRRRYFDRWRLRIEATEREVRTVSFLDEGEARQQGFDTAKALAALLQTLDEATNEGATQASYKSIDQQVLKVAGEVTALGGFWKDD